MLSLSIFKLPVERMEKFIRSTVKIKTVERILT